MRLRHTKLFIAFFVLGSFCYQGDIKAMDPDEIDRIARAIVKEYPNLANEDKESQTWKLNKYVEAKTGFAFMTGKVDGVPKVSMADRKPIIDRAFELSKEKQIADEQAKADAKANTVPNVGKLVIPKGLPGGTTTGTSGSSIATNNDINTWVAKNGNTIVAKLRTEQGVTDSSQITFDKIRKASGDQVKKNLPGTGSVAPPPPAGKGNATMPKTPPSGGPPPPPPAAAKAGKGNIPLPKPPSGGPPPPPPGKGKAKMPKIPPSGGPPPPPPVGKGKLQPSQQTVQPASTHSGSSAVVIKPLTVDKQGADYLTDKIKQLFDSSSSSAFSPSGQQPASAGGGQSSGTSTSPSGKLAPPPGQQSASTGGSQSSGTSSSPSGNVAPPSSSGQGGSTGQGTLQPSGAATSVVDIRDALKLATKLHTPAGQTGPLPSPPPPGPSQSSSTGQGALQPSGAATTVVDIRDALKLAAQLNTSAGQTNPAPSPPASAQLTLEQAVEQGNLGEVEQKVQAASDQKLELRKALGFAKQHDKPRIALKMLESSSNPDDQRILQELQATGLDAKMKAGQVTVRDAIDHVEKINKYERSDHLKLDSLLAMFMDQNSFKKHGKSYQSQGGGLNKKEAKDFDELAEAIQEDHKQDPSAEDVTPDQHAAWAKINEGLHYGMFKDNAFLTEAEFDNLLPQYEDANSDYSKLMQEFTQGQGLNEADARQFIHAAQFLDKEASPMVIIAQDGLDEKVFDNGAVLTDSQVQLRIPALKWYKDNLGSVMKEIGDYIEMELDDNPNATYDDFAIDDKDELGDLVSKLGLPALPNPCDTDHLITLINTLIHDEYDMQKGN